MNNTISNCSSFCSIHNTWYAQPFCPYCCPPPCPGCGRPFAAPHYVPGPWFVPVYPTYPQYSPWPPLGTFICGGNS